LFLVLFTGLSAFLQWLPVALPPLARASLVALGSLAVVGWPVLRGIPWTQVRQDVGWTLGRNPLLEPVLGLTCYVLALPIVLIGLGLTLVLIAVRNQLEALGLGVLAAEHQPIHPIVEFIVSGSTLDRVLVFVDACILAPIVEETMFRGVLYRHLRELSHPWPWIGSVLFSGTIVSFIFAVIHPQGLVAVPVLMALAYGFTIAREWRGSLVPSMVGHALNNGLVVLFVLLMMGR
jgi:membrane protease YdiL (CAAX protease family)